MAVKETKPITAHLPQPLVDQLEQAALRIERSRNWVIRQALLVWLLQEEERERLTHEGLADIDIGNVIDHQAIQAWANSLSTNTPLLSPMAG